MSAARVAVLTNFVPAYRAPVLRTLARWFPDLRVLVSHRSAADNLAGVEGADGLDVRLLSSVALARIRRHPSGFRQRERIVLPYGLAWALFAHAPDVVLSSELGFRTLVAVAYRRARPRSRLIVHADLSERTEAGRGRLRTLLRRFLLARADAVIVNGRSGARYVGALGVPAPRIATIPYAAADAFFGPDAARRPAGAVRRLLYVGQFIEVKGLEPFIAALAEWCAAHRPARATLTLLGAGPLRDRITAMQTPANLALELREPVPQHALPAIYAAADVLVFPTLGDTWGLVVSEAMAAGLPVLGSTAGQAVEELVADGRSGWLFRPGDAASATAAIARMMAATPEELAAMGRAARTAAERCRPDAVAAMFRQAIEGVLDRARGD